MHAAFIISAVFLALTYFPNSANDISWLLFHRILSSSSPFQIMLSDNTNLPNRSVSPANSSHEYEGEEYTVEDISFNQDDQNNISTSGDHDSYVPECSDELKPFKKMIFPTLNDAYEFYKKYGVRSGFDVRRDCERKSRDGTVISKQFVCNRAGSMYVKQTDKENHNVNRTRRTVVGRCGCKARLLLRFVGHRGYSVTDFEERHNHELVSKDLRHFMQVNRNISPAHQMLIMDAARSGVGPSKTFLLAKQMSGTFDNIGATCTDFRNFSRDVKAYIGSNDGQMVVDRFKQKKELCDDYFYEYDTDSDGHITKLFWADAISRRNYELFGDVVSFDATFRTNKYCMAFAPFTGVDNYKRCVTFAAGLISAENVEHYSWLFSAFVKCMKRQPVCIITDQCPAMKQAIPLIFTETRHRLCMWHIMNKFTSKIGASMPLLTEFMSEINNLIWNDAIEPEEFDASWTTIIEEYNLQDNSWLNEMFRMKKMWIPAYFRDVPMEGLLRTTSRSEAENSYLNQFRRKWDSLSEFFLLFDTFLDMQRHTNSKLIYESCKSLPMTETPLLIEKDAAEIYTRPVFYDVQAEIKDSCFNLLIQSLEDLNEVKKFVLKERSRKPTIYQVELRTDTEEVDCSYNKFVRVGILCSHALFALTQAGIHKIPRRYVSNRWMKNVEKRIPTSLNLDGSESDEIKSRLNEIWVDFHACVSLAGSDNSRIEMCHKTIKDLKGELRELSGRSVNTRSQNIIQITVGSQPIDGVSVLPPKESRNKGCGKRILSAGEKAIAERKRKGRRKCHTCLEVGDHDSRTCTMK